MSLTDLHHLLAVAGRPTYVKTAAEQDAPGPDAQYIDGARQLPVHTREATFCSALKIAADDSLKSHQFQLEKFAAFWGIRQDVADAQAKIASDRNPPAVELPDSDYVLRQTHMGQPVRKYAAYDSPSLVKAASAFHANRHRYPIEWRKQAAAEFLRRAVDYHAEFEPQVGDYLWKAAHLGYPSVEAVDRAVLQRTALLPQQRNITTTQKLASALAVIADSPTARYNSDMVGQTLATLDKFDREMKLAGHYGDQLDLPEEMLDLTVERVMKTAAYNEGEVRLQNGQTVNVNSLQKEALAAVDPDLADMPAKKLAAVLPTLPAPDADLLTDALQTKTAASRTAPGFEVMDELRVRSRTPSAGSKATPAPAKITDKGLKEAGAPMMGAGGLGGPQTQQAASPMPPAAPQAPAAPPPKPPPLPNEINPLQGAGLQQTEGQAPPPGGAPFDQPAGAPEMPEAPVLPDAPTPDITDDPMMAGASPSSEEAPGELPGGEMPGPAMGLAPEAVSAPEAQGPAARNQISGLPG